MTKDELRRKYLLKPESPAVRNLLWHAFQQDDLPPRKRSFDGTAPLADQCEFRRLYDEYHTELAHYQPVASASAR
jgi:hypothetical protein